ncbi:outer membrane lipoprotein-sorting protein [Neisseria sp. HSC-16F19]|nr:outer membrane lipoprotein carrier protein LolA [Neisseria sp. HSC-16F19]MCP2040747.1 outer membrane lipoprotein-sorting protein [Neisseria sp. HSC-16F19]
MKKILFSTLLVLAAPFAWAFSAAELTQTLQKPAHVQGAFTQQRFLKSLDKPMTTQGRFVLVPKQGLLWHMHKPFENRLRVRADGIRQWNGSQWTADAKAAKQNRQIQLFLDLLGGNTAGLEQQFTLEARGTAQNWTLELTPKTAVMRQIFNRIELQGDSLVRRIELAERQGDRTVIQFKDLSTSQPLDAFAKQALY